MFDLRGKQALVSGAGAPNGIGIAIARALRELGASNVAITSTTERIHDRARELNLNGYVADLREATAANALAKNFSSLDILVNNAGMTSISAPMQSGESTDLTMVSATDWQQGIKRNLDTTFNLTRAFLPLLRKSQSGRIIMISSVTGGLMAMSHQPVYAAAKAAMIGLTKSLALDEAKYAITCNAVLPGWIATDTQPDHEKLQGMRTPLRRNGTPLEIASLVAWLATRESGYMTGQSLVVDGGNCIAEERV